MQAMHEGVCERGSVCEARTSMQHLENMLGSRLLKRCDCVCTNTTAEDCKYGMQRIKMRRIDGRNFLRGI